MRAGGVLTAGIVPTAPAIVSYRPLARLHCCPPLRHSHLTTSQTTDPGIAERAHWGAKDVLCDPRSGGGAHARRVEVSLLSGEIDPRA